MKTARNMYSYILTSKNRRYLGFKIKNASNVFGYYDMI